MLILMSCGVCNMLIMMSHGASTSYPGDDVGKNYKLHLMHLWALQVMLQPLCCSSCQWNVSGEAAEGAAVPPAPVCCCHITMCRLLTQTRPLGRWRSRRTESASCLLRSSRSTFCCSWCVLWHIEGVNASHQVHYKQVWTKPPHSFCQNHPASSTDAGREAGEEVTSLTTDFWK